MKLHLLTFDFLLEVVMHGYLLKTPTFNVAAGLNFPWLFARVIIGLCSVVVLVLIDELNFLFSGDFVQVFIS